MPSAVKVFPVPGGPCRTATKPRPLPWTTSSIFRLFCRECDVTRALTIDFWLSGSCNDSNALSFHSISFRPETENSSHSLNGTKC